MVIMVGGIPTSGKSKLLRNIIEDMSCSKTCDPYPLFPCQSHKDILVVGRYPEGQPFGGSDRISYGAIPHFRDFIRQEQPNWKHIIIEGDRFFRSQDITWVCDNYDSKVFVLTVSDIEEHRRHIQRQDTQTDRWLKGRRTQIRNILTDIVLMGSIEVRSNETMEDSRNLKEEIKNLLNVFTQNTGSIPK